MAEILQEYPSKGKSDMQTILKRINLVFDQEQDIFVVSKLITLLQEIKIIL